MPLFFLGLLAGLLVFYESSSVLVIADDE